MKKQITLRLLFVSLLASMTLVTNAEIIEHTTDDGFNYQLDTETKSAELTKYSGSATEVIIPTSVIYENDTYMVTKLGDYAFNHCSTLTAIDIPSSVTSIGNYSFSYCILLASITVDINNKVYDSRENCNAIIETATNTMIFGCMNTVIPPSVTSLESNCFLGCESLTSITLPSSVTSLKGNIFRNCLSLKSITVDGNNKVYDSRENCNAVIETATNSMISGCINTVIPSSVTSLGENCFCGCSSLTSIDIPSSVTNLESGCFFDCESLTSITFPSSVTSLGDFCFYGCSSLISVDIPSSVTSLGKSCFRLCSSLTSITIPSSVTSIGNACFFFCPSLKIVTCKIKTAIKGNYFFDVPFEQATLYVPKASLESYKTTSPWNGFGTILPITSTGINYNTTNKSDNIDAIYDLNGKRINGTSHAINIIRMSDGTTRKVMK